MIIRKLGLLGLILAGLTAGATAAPAAESWVGAWGYTAMPLPPGLTPAVPPPAPVPMVPLAVPTSTSLTVAAVQPPSPLLDNPGNLPVVAPPAELANVTIRQLVRVSATGKRIRLRLSNEGGADVMALGAVHVGLAGADGAVLAGSDKAVTFDGKNGVLIPAGAPLLSDPIDLPVKALDKLLISIHVPGPVTRGGHSLFQYVATAPGDTGGATQLPGARIMRLTALVTEVDVAATGNVVVTLGDSITEGALSTSNAFRGWPDRLAERLAPRGWSVVNAGIGGNRLLRYAAGPNALARLDRDVLSVPGVKAVILLEGINDIGRGFFPATSTEIVTAEALIAADRQIIARAHAKGIRVIGATLTPYEGANYHTPKGEDVREAVNKWILTGGEFDGVLDFAAVTADPANPKTFRADYNLRDHLHPNDTGYAAIGDAIDLKVVTGR